MITEIQKLMMSAQNNEKTSKALTKCHSDLEQQKELVKKLKEENITKSQEEQKQDQAEKQSLHSMITKLTQEKERIQDLQRERQKESDRKI